MKILIIGGNSSVAKKLKPLLSSFATLTTAGKTNCDEFLDLRDEIPNTLQKEYDIVIHLAAAFSGDSFEDMYNTEYVNVLGTLKLLDALEYKHYIYISSIFSHLNETSEFFNSYSLSKKHAEEIALLYCQKNKKNLTILRPSSIYGDKKYFEKHQPFLYEIIRKAKHNESIVFYGEHDPLRNYIHIDDLVNIIERVILNKVYGTFDCLNLSDISYREVLNFVSEILDKEVIFRFDKTKKNIADNVFVKNDTLYQLINYSPSITYKEGIQRILNEEKL